jgi:hypothetical protein
MMLGKTKMETRQERTAKMKTGFLILVATHNLQNLPAWLTLEKLRFVFTLLSNMELTQQLSTETCSDNRGAVQMVTAQQPTHQRPRHIHMKQICHSLMV